MTKDETEALRVGDVVQDALLRTFTVVGIRQHENGTVLLDADGLYARVRGMPAWRFSCPRLGGWARGGRGEPAAR